MADTMIFTLELHAKVQRACRIRDDYHARGNWFCDHCPGYYCATFPNISREDGTIADPALVPNCDLGMLGLGKVSTCITAGVVAATSNQHV